MRVRARVVRVLHVRAGTRTVLSRCTYDECADVLALMIMHPPTSTWDSAQPRGGDQSADLAKNERHVFCSMCLTCLSIYREAVDPSLTLGAS